MENLIQEIIKNFDGATVTEKRDEKDKFFSQIASKEISNILAAQAKNKVEVQNA